MAEAALAVVYDGPEVRGGRMEVRDLAPALLALGDLFSEAGRLLYPDTDPVALKIEATREGSFDVALILEASGMWDQIVGMFSSDDATAIANLIAYVTGAAGLFAVAVKIKNRRVVKESAGPQQGQITLTMEDGTELTVDASVLALYKDIRIRKNARKVVDPLGIEGINRLDFRANDDITVSVGKNDVPSLEVPVAEPTEMLDEEISMILEIASPAFVDGNKWRFTTGDQSFFAAIDDMGFLARVDRGEPFSKGDALRCRVKLVQSQKADGGIQTEYRIAEVVQHIKRPTQLRLDTPSDP